MGLVAADRLGLEGLEHHRVRLGHDQQVGHSVDGTAQRLVEGRRRQHELLCALTAGRHAHTGEVVLLEPTRSLVVVFSVGDVVAMQRRRERQALARVEDQGQHQVRSRVLVGRDGSTGEQTPTAHLDHDVGDRIDETARVVDLDAAVTEGEAAERRETLGVRRLVQGASREGLEHVVRDEGEGAGVQRPDVSVRRDLQELKSHVLRGE